MKTSITELLRQNHTDKTRTIYMANAPEINQFDITAGNFFSLDPVEKWDGDTWVQKYFWKFLEEKRKGGVYLALSEQRDSLQSRIRKIKEIDGKGYEHAEELRALRRAKRGLAEALEGLSCRYRTEAIQELERNFGIRKMELFSYKNTACVGSFADLECHLPALSELSLPWFRRSPILLANMKSVCLAAEARTPIGLVGGPCLFGTYEVEIQILHRDGRRFFFDFSSGRHYDIKAQGSADFAEHVEAYAGEIEDIDFCNWKKGVTAQEYDSLEILFAFGRLLGAKVAIPIPDISYLKYLSTVLAPIEEQFRRRILERFRAHTRRIADLYLRVIERLQARYPEVETQVLHERNEALCRRFHEEREKYFRKSGLIHRMTKKRQKTDAVFDYISMLALPYYIWGTPQVIQIDNLDETDSYRKCRKVHKEAFSLSAVLYPERLSADGENTIFNAPLEYKEYLGKR